MEMEMEIHYVTKLSSNSYTLSVSPIILSIVLISYIL